MSSFSILPSYRTAIVILERSGVYSKLFSKVIFICRNFYVVICNYLAVFERKKEFLLELTGFHDEKNTPINRPNTTDNQWECDELYQCGQQIHRKRIQFRTVFNFCTTEDAETA